MLAIVNLASPYNLFVRLIRAIVAGDTREAAELLESSPSLARQCLSEGATRQAPTDFFFKRIRHYLYGGDTPLHAAAAAYQLSIVKKQPYISVYSHRFTV